VKVLDEILSEIVLVTNNALLYPTIAPVPL